MDAVLASVITSGVAVISTSTVAIWNTRQEPRAGPFRGTGWNTQRCVGRESIIKLLSAVLANQPALPGAACRGRHEVLDPSRGNGHRYKGREQIRLEEAARVCAGCPVMQRCPSRIATLGTIPSSPPASLVRNWMKPPDEPQRYPHGT